MIRKYSVAITTFFAQLALLWIGKTQQDQANYLFKDSNTIFLLSVIPFAVFLSTANLFCLLIPWRIASSIGAFSVGVISFSPLTYFASCGSYLNGYALSIAFETETRALLNVVTDRISMDFFAIGIVSVTVSQLAIWTEPPTTNRKSWIYAVYAVILSALCGMPIIQKNPHPVRALFEFEIVSIRGNSFTKRVPSSPENLLSKPQKPDIIVIAIESFSAQFLNALGEDGKPITPCFNRIAKNSVEVERFYSGSMFTLKGHESILLGVSPSLYGPIAVDSGTNVLVALPSALKRCGYSTAFYQAYSDIRFASTDLLASRTGFTRIKSMNGEFVDPSYIDSIWGWGLQDDVFYDIVLDDIRKNLITDPTVPIFAFLATISNHQPFNDLPKHLRTAYANPRNLYQRYANSMRASDLFLGEIVNKIRSDTRLKESIIIVTADHSFSVGDNGEPDVERSTRDVSFRIPLLIQWPGHLNPQKITRGQYSHKNICPTVLSLIGDQDAANRFVDSILLDSLSIGPATFVQPYSGGYVGAVQWPFKLIYSVARRREAVVNLELDSKERTNIINQIPTQILEKLRSAVNFALMERDIKDRFDP
jgi:hypothetical protein